MKSITIIALASAVAAQGWLPSCSWSDCMGSWDASSCNQSSGWDCFCSNSTAIAQINTCVATSCTNATDQETIYEAVAQLCANAGKSVTNSQEATFSATSGGSAWPTSTGGWGPQGSWNSASWSSWASQVSTAIGSAPSGWGPGNNWGTNWGGPSGRTGGFGPGGVGPWATKASGIACSGTASWTTWTGGWGPGSSWTGLWSGCSSTTATPSPATVTSTVTSNGQTSVITGTTFGIQAVASSSGSGSASKSGSAAAGSIASLIDTTKVMTLSGLVAGSVFALMVTL